MSAWEKDGKKGCLLCMESGPTLSNYRQDRTAQTSGDLRLAPVSLGRDLGSHRKHPVTLGASALPSPPGPRTAQALPTRGWPSVLLALRCCILPKLALLQEIDQVSEWRAM